ncbi:S41 family peptidase [Paenibacillus tepidiphilus]|uniref:S41 family peptidase n=1 Tax=Paenibacillus tepidiphilus TaxID=2608683 RepID=UPI0012384275|nr:S41 family peptidase [Paenibacillus tepidiphilus]
MKRTMMALSAAVLLLLPLAGCTGEQPGAGNPVPADEDSPVLSINAAPTAEPASPAAAQPSEMPSSVTTLTVEQKLEDFDYIYTVLQQNFPFFEVNKRVYGVDWLANKEAYRDTLAATGDDAQFFESFNQILGELHNLHTYLLNPDMYAYMRESYRNEPTLQPWNDILQQPQVERRYGVSDHAAGPGAETGGKDGTIQAIPVNKANVMKRILEQGQSAYVWIRSFAKEQIDYDGPMIRDFLQEIKDYRTLIIDIRGNGGGSQMYWMNMVEQLIDQPLPDRKYLLFTGDEYQQPFLKSMGYETQPISRLDLDSLPNHPPETTQAFTSYFVSSYNIPPAPVGFKGDIYLIVDEGVYSSSESFASYAKNTGFATLIGEKTGGDGIGITPIFAALPNSGYVLNFSWVLGLTKDGTCNEEFKTVPDVTVDAERNKDWHLDPAIQKALELAAAKR